MGATHSHSASVRVSPVYRPDDQVHHQNYKANTSLTEVGGNMVEITRSSGSEPFLACSPNPFIKPTFRRATSNHYHHHQHYHYPYHNHEIMHADQLSQPKQLQQHSSQNDDCLRRKHEQLPFYLSQVPNSSVEVDSFTAFNNVLVDPSAQEGTASAWLRNVSQKRARAKPTSFKQTSHNSTNSSYIPDCSPEGSIEQSLEVCENDPYKQFVTVNEHLKCVPRPKTLLPETSKWTLNGYHAPHASKCLLGSPLLTDQSEDIPTNRVLYEHSAMPKLMDFNAATKDLSKSAIQESRISLAQRRHFSELNLHLEQLNLFQSSPQISSKRLPTSAAFNTANFEFADMEEQSDRLQNPNQTMSVYNAPITLSSPIIEREKSTANDFNKNVSSYFANKSAALNYISDIVPSCSMLSSEADLIKDGKNEHDYVNLPNLPQICPKNFKLTSNLRGLELGESSEASYKESNNIAPAERRPSKPRWRLIIRGKSLTKSLSCYALKFFNQQHNRNFESAEPNPSTATSGTTMTNQKINRDLKQNFRRNKFSSNDMTDDLGYPIHRALHLSEENAHTEESIAVERATRKWQGNRPRYMNRSLSAFGNRDLVVNHNQKDLNVLKRIPPLSSARDPHKRDRLTLMQTSTRDLLQCLSLFVVQTCDSLCSSHDAPLYPEEIATWIKDVDRALLQQGWTDIPFLNPANLVFLYVLLRGSICVPMTCSRELHSTVMVCLYLAYSYMGNEISYPLKPFLNAEILYSMLHEKDPQRLQSINSANLVPTRNPKITAQFRERFWEKCIQVLHDKSRDMLQLNADPLLFTESIAELRAYGNSEMKSA